MGFARTPGSWTKVVWYVFALTYVCCHFVIFKIKIKIWTNFPRLTVFLFLAGPQNLTVAESFNESLWALARYSFFLVFSTCSSARWIFSVVPSDCWVGKRLAKHLLQIRSWPTPLPAWWSASWQPFLSRVRPQPLPSSFQWSLPGVSSIIYLFEQFMIW